jgi:NADH-quinone oxidoreductase subunit N
VNPTVTSLIDYFPYLGPEIVLGVAACVLFLGGTWRAGRHLWGTLALVALALAALLLWRTPVRSFADRGGAEASVFAAPVVFDRLALLIRVLSLAGGAVLVLTSWDEVPDDQAADYHACLLLMIAGMNFTALANELVTLFLSLELVSIPTYVLLYLPRVDRPAQEAAMKYFLLSVFSSALLLFGFSYLYGLAGTTNLPAMAGALGAGPLPGVALVALVMVVAGLGFRITAVPFHFYAPDVYQGTTTAAAALLAFVPKVAGFAALVRVLGFVLPAVPGAGGVVEARPAAALGDQVPFLFWIVAAVTMTLGNILALLQDNLKRLLAYSSVAHAGYMLIGLAVAPRLPESAPVGGVAAVFFYLVCYGAMTVGAFAVLAALSTPRRPVETVDDVAGLGYSHPGLGLLLLIFLLSLIGIPLTAGFMGKLLLFLDALGVPAEAADPQALSQRRLFISLAVIGVVNAAIGGWYYLRVVAAMYLREPPEPLPPPRGRPVLTAVGICATLTLFFGVYPEPLKRAVQAAVPRAAAPEVAHTPGGAGR